jgi:hypothetical protein
MALALRAALVGASALTALLVLPGTDVFAGVARWSLHVVAGPPHVDLSGEPLAHLSALGPPAVIGLSLLAFALTRRTLGRGPATAS